MSKIRLQAHRGVSSEFPENTFAAFQAAIDEGYDIIELDPKYTADNHIVILHDRTVNRTGRRQDGSALPPDTAIKDLTFAQARELEYGSWKDPKFKGEKIPSLEELIDFIKAHDIPFKFDNVWETFPPEQQEIFLSQLEKANLGSKIGFTCRKPECFALVAKRFPQAELHWDGANDKATLEDVVKVAAGHRLTIWVCYDNKLTGWFKGAKATAELCDMVHQFGEIGIWILSQEAELDDTVNVFKANAIETTGHIKPSMVYKEARMAKCGIRISNEPMSLEDTIRFEVKHHNSLIIHGSKEALEKILIHFPYNFVIEINNEIKPEVIIGNQKYFDDGNTSLVPPNWYSEFCTYCKTHIEQNCVLLIYGIMKCEPSKQVLLNNLLQEQKLRVDKWPLPANSSIIVFDENDKNEASAFYNITGEVARRCAHMYLN